jgi:hypothetical protein
MLYTNEDALVLDVNVADGKFLGQRHLWDSEEMYESGSDYCLGHSLLFVCCKER